MKRFAKISAAVAVSAIVLAAALFVNVWYFKPVTIDAFYTSMFARFALERPGTLSEILIHGSLPLVVLERVIDDWIARVEAA